MDNDYILNKLRRIELLPTFPNIVREVLGIIEDPMSSASDLARHLDPSMVGEILRIANSAYFGTRNFRNIATIEHAIAVIGYKQLSHIILQMPFISMIGGDDKGFDRNKFIRHSIICGAITDGISSVTFLGNPNEAYISGVMHDIGVIILYRYFKEQWDSILTLISDKKLSRLEAEKEVLSVNHGYVGAKLLEMWNIPKPITDSVMFHHNPEESEENMENVAVTFLGNIFSKKIDFKNDLISFADFMAIHRDFIEQITRFRQNISSNYEIRIFRKIYDALKNVNNYIEEVVGKDND
ncbi:MAG: HDOD domain-containing protein [Proteobacteria bacterium]|nr:HDOD domain-containing protein [Pseudomonadota bacterium]